MSDKPIYLANPRRVVCVLCSNGWNFPTELKARQYIYLHARFHADTARLER